MLENVVDPIPYLQTVKTKAGPFKIQTGYSVTYEKFYELLIEAATIHRKKFK